MTTSLRDTDRPSRAGPSDGLGGGAEAVRRAGDSRWTEWAARLGFAGRGVIYLIIGVLALQIATGDNQGREADRKGALQEVADKPFGGALLVVLAVGIAGYALWRFSNAAWGERSESDEKKRTVKRLSSAGKGVLYLAFLASVISVLVGRGRGGDGSGGGGGGEQQATTWTAKVLGWPSGRLLVAAAGVAIVAGAGYMIYRGIRRKFEKHLDEGRMGPTTRRVVPVVGAVGLSARGVVFGLAGLLLIKAAADFDPNEAKGVDGTLRTIAAQPYGQILLVAAALGLVAFGVYSFVEARWRRL